MKYVIALSTMFLMGLFATCGTKEEPKIIPKKVVESPPPEKKPIIIAVIDTGFDFESTWNQWHVFSKPKLCKFGHQDFSGKGIKDIDGHGTHIAGLIGKYAENAHYCLVILKYYNKEAADFNENLENSNRALQKAIDLKVDIINYSAGGSSESLMECHLIRRALDQGIAVVVAAGNEKSNINKHPYYPAMCDDRLMAVQSIDIQGKTSKFSNFTDDYTESKFLFKEIGENVLSYLPNNQMGYYSGTSQSTAIKTGKLTIEMEKNGIIGKKSQGE